MERPELLLEHGKSFPGCPVAVGDKVYSRRMNADVIVTALSPSDSYPIKGLFWGKITKQWLNCSTDVKDIRQKHCITLEAAIVRYKDGKTCVSTPYAGQPVGYVTAGGGTVVGHIEAKKTFIEMPDGSFVVEES